MLASLGPQPGRRARCLCWRACRCASLSSAPATSASCTPPRWSSSATPSSRWTSTSRRSRAAGRHGPDLRARPARAAGRGAGHRAADLHHGLRRTVATPRCTSCAWARRSDRARTRPTCATWTPRSRRWPSTCTRRRLVVGKSTVPVGTARPAATRCCAPRRRAGTDVTPGVEPRVPARGLRGQGHAAPGPARLRRRGGRAPGADAGPAGRGVRRDDRRRHPVVVTDFATAELVKASANAFLATKISFINAMSEVCEAAGADVVSARRGDRARRPDRAPSSSAPASASAAAACPRTSAPSWRGPASSAPTRP